MKNNTCKKGQIVRAKWCYFEKQIYFIRATHPLFKNKVSYKSHYSFHNIQYKKTVTSSCLEMSQVDHNTDSQLDLDFMSVHRMSDEALAEGNTWI